MKTQHQFHTVTRGSMPFRLAYSLSGPPSGPAVVQLHGLSSSRAREDAVGSNPTAGSRNLRVLRIDAPGHGHSGGSTDPGDYTWAGYSRLVAELVEEIFPGRLVHGVGTSMGAGVLLHAAVDKRVPLQSLSLLIPPTAWRLRAAQSQGYEATAEFIESQGLAAFVSLGAQFAPPPAVDPAQPVLPPDLGEEFAPAIYRGAARSDLPGLAQLSHLVQPTQILAWAGDPSHPEATAVQLRESLRTVHYQVARTPAEVAGWSGLVGEFVAGVG